MATGLTALRVALLVSFVVLTSLLTASAMMWGEYVAEKTAETGSRPTLRILVLGLGVLLVMLWITLGVLRPDLIDQAFDPSKPLGPKNFGIRIAASVAVAALFSVLSFLAFKRHRSQIGAPAPAAAAEPLAE